LDNVVTSTLVFEGEGRVEEYVGGYEDWQRQRQPVRSAIAAATPVRAGAVVAPAPSRQSAPIKKLSYRERLEFDGLPARIEALEAEQTALEAAIGGGDFYKESASAIASTLARLESVRVDLDACYRRWDELDSRVK